MHTEHEGKCYILEKLNPSLSSDIKQTYLF